MVVAWQPHASGHIVDYGRVEVASVDMGVEKALSLALREFGEMCCEGWRKAKTDDDPTKLGEPLLPDMILIDAGYQIDVVYNFCSDSTGFHAAVGRGATQQRQQWYNRPTATGSIVKHIGEGFHVNWIRASHQYLFEINADHWKTWVHQRLTTPIGEPGAMTIFQSPPHEHLSLAKHLTAERKTEEFMPGKGVVTRWERIRKNNHWFDALYNACAAGHYAGVRLLGGQPRKPRRYGKLSSLAQAKREERKWFDNERWDDMMGRYLGNG